jgi:hypothetical protein
MTVRIPREIRVLIAGLAPERKKRVRAALKRIEKDPEVGKALEDELYGFRTVPVPPLRIVYLVTALEVQIQIIELRPVVYEQFLQQLALKSPPASS